MVRWCYAKFCRTSLLLISHSYNFVFIHVPKTGGNSIQWALQDYSEDRLYIRNPRTQDGMNRFAVADGAGLGLEKHSTWNDIEKAYGTLQGYLRFATIRNPFNKLVSSYFSPHRGEVAYSADGFEEFVRSVRPLEDYVCNSDGVMMTDMLLRFENIAEDFAAVCHQIGIGQIPIPRLNQRQRQGIPCLYDNKLRLYVEKRHAYEIDIGGYSFDQSVDEAGY